MATMETNLSRWNQPQARLPALTDLSRFRDEIRVRLHLAGVAAKSRWETLEPKLMSFEQELSRRSEPSMKLATEIAMETVDLLRNFLIGFPAGVQLETEQGGTRVSDVMSRNVVACAEHDTLATAARLMWDADCGGLPVLDADRRPIGFITDRDICMAAYTQGGALESLRVASAMSRSPECCGLDDTISSVEERLRTRKIRRMPVVDSTGRIVGVITLADIARDIERRAVGVRLGAEEAEVNRTLAAICEPRLQHQ
jgi:CBS domain-containing protein